MVARPEHALWEGHFHTHTMCAMGLLAYALALSDSTLMKFCASFYEYSRLFGFARIGHFPSVIGPPDLVNHHNPMADPERPTKGFLPMVSEGCGTGDMIWLAVTLSLAGIGDYWEDVDLYVRNHLAEQQILHRHFVEAMIAAGPPHVVDPCRETDDRIVDRVMGAFVSPSDPTLLYGWYTTCCLNNCCVGLYKAWEAIVRARGDAAQVSLLLNRASPWLDVDSYLPYEGKVVLRNKTARVVHVRIPRWVEKRAVRCWVNEGDTSLDWLSNYLVVGALAPNDVVTIRFPMAERLERHTAVSYGRAYTCRFKGNTMVDISPRPERPAWTHMGSDDGNQFPVNVGYPIYLRDSYRTNEAPTKTVERYVAPTIIR